MRQLGPRKELVSFVRFDSAQSYNEAVQCLECSDYLRLLIKLCDFIVDLNLYATARTQEGAGDAFL
ncbi:hypothetical protein DPMN_088365 [Dreissena polymorpha]|uniref:Uncharacterized protein n=1 Tax=Dreissena polymorpha TaxID=45954 RepID=A0A9D4KW26_DREPO|nr:hypothetical protein DPMN_088365 [Dreissena polymorpha]